MEVAQVASDALGAAVVLVVVEAVAVAEAAQDVVVVAVDAVADAADVAEADNQLYTEEEISGGFAQDFEHQSSILMYHAVTIMISSPWNRQFL